jgi:DNA-binding CsgD family transcriptional regulator/DNA-binding transcriptional regulator GbsR (MarR family)
MTRRVMDLAGGSEGLAAVPTPNNRVVLSELGVEPDAEAVYLTLVGSGRPMSVDEIVGRAGGLRRRELAVRLRNLEKAGLLVRTGTDRDLFAPVDPSQAFRDTLARQRKELRQAEARVEALTEQFRQVASERDVGYLIDVVAGPEAIMAEISRIERATSHLIRATDRPPYHSGGETDPDEFYLLERGVTAQAVYAREGLEIPGRLGQIQACIAAGEQARVLAEVPVKLLISDDRIATLPLQAGHDLSPTFIVVRRSALLEALIGLFETLWRLAIPIPTLGTNPDLPVMSGGLTPAEQQIMTLLSTGMTDEAIATTIGVSTRTYHRRIQHIMQLAGADTRVQLGIHAQRSGWLKPNLPRRPRHPGAGQHVDG